MTKIKDLSPEFRLQPAEVELALEPGVDPIGSSVGGLSTFSNSFKRGYGNEVFGSDSRGIWLGAADFTDAPFRVDMEGHLFATGASITGVGVNFVSTLEWTPGGVDSATWSSGIIKTSNGTVYNITSDAVTGVAAKTYIYLDPAVSITDLQSSIDPEDAAGSDIVLIAIVSPAEGGSLQASVDVIGGSGTVISGNQIATNSIVADRLDVSTLSAISADLGTVTAGAMTGVTIAIGSANNIFKADSNGIYLGNATFASAPFRVNMSGQVTATSLTLTNASIGSGSSYTGNQIGESYISDLSAGKITTGTLSADRIGAGSITASKLSVSTLSAITANLGTVTAGTIDGLTINLPTSSAGSDPGSTGYLKWNNNSKIWADSSNRMGINSIGSPMYIYVNSSERIVVPSSGQVTLRGGSYNDGNVNVTGEMRVNKIMMNQSSDENNIEAVNIIKGYNDVNFQLGNNSYYFSFYNTSFDEKAHIDSSGNIQKDGSVSFDIIHPEIPNYRLRYPAIEAPEVALKIRGIAKLKNGVAKINTPHHWSLVNEKDGLITVLLTPTEDCKGLFAPKDKITFTSFEVKELQGGKSNAEFAWELTCVRKNYLNFNPEYPMTPEQIEKMRKMAIRKVEFIKELQDLSVDLGMERKDVDNVKDIEVLIQLTRDLNDNVKRDIKIGK